MTTDPMKKRRGRDERMAERAQAARPVVWKGMAGGQFAPLAAVDIPKIQAAALQVLETTGVADVVAAYVPGAGIPSSSAAGPSIPICARARFPAARANRRS